MPGKFITIEGIEGVGKSTAIQCIAQYLSDKQIQHKITREPGGTGIAEDIRHLLLKKHQETMSDDTELLLMFAARAQHIAHVIRPTMKTGDWVVCDRFTDASYAYQGGGRGIDIERIAGLESWVQQDLRPDCTLLLDAPVDIALARAKKRSEPDRIEAEEKEFFEKVRDAYLALAAKNPERFVIISAEQKLEDVEADIRRAIDNLMSA